jgi:hypothetical protein
VKKCPHCGKLVPELLYDLHLSVDDMIIGRMKRENPGWSEHDGICGPCLARYHGLTVTKMKRCPLCGQLVPELLYDLHLSADDMIVARLKRDFPGWSQQQGACGPCLERYRGMEAIMLQGVKFTAAAIRTIWFPR